MPKVVLPLAHTRRLAALLSSLAAVADGDLAERAKKAVAWLEGELACQQDDTQQLRDRVNSLRREWREFPNFTALEENFFRAHEENFARLETCDWDVMRDFLAYVPKSHEKLFQVEMRERFLKSPKETLADARRWHGTHRAKPGYFKPQPAEQHEFSMDDFREMFRELKESG